MKYTENYGLNLPEGTDFVDVEHFNENAEKVDEVLKTLEEPEHDTATQSELEELTSGESLKIALRKLAKAVADYISHKADKVAHITSEERKKWNDANTKKHEHGNKSVLDAATASYTTEEKTKLNGIATGANKYTHPSYTAKTGVPTANQTPGFGGTFTISQPISDATGHITAMNSRTVTIPKTAATTSAPGLMSAADKTKLDGITSGADSVAFSRSLTSGTKIGTITINGTASDVYCQTNTDTKNTAGSTDSSSKLFLIGATSQAANPQTYSQDTAYVGTDGHLYSNGKKVVNLSDSQALTNKTYNGYTLAEACAKKVTDSPSAAPIGTGTNLVTERDVYYGLPVINGSHTYASFTSIYAPTSAGTSGYTLKSNGSGAPSWVNIGEIVSNNYFVQSSGNGVLTYIEAAINLSAGIWLVQAGMRTDSSVGRYIMQTINATENVIANGAVEHLIDKTVGYAGNQSLEWMDIINLSSAATIYPACTSRPEADTTHNSFSFTIRAIRIK